MALYNDVLMEHFLNPRNAGAMDAPDAVGEAGTDRCGDIMKLYLKVADGKITDVRCETYGCSVAIAAGSVTSELLKGRTLAEALALKNAQIAEVLGGLPEEKLHCSVLAEDAVKAAVNDYRRKYNGV
ncbi:MAG: iron-sulfur cluster assembly scaffold protein [Clostridia bacterium]|nr:iron-sulfur cluster assembly scaffold protein [Clostridia bacterium]